MFDFVIIGGGIIGLLTAKELQNNGANVAIIEKSSVGQQATWAAGGILSPMRPWHYCDAVNAISSISQSIYQQLSNELLEETGIDPQWVLSGMLILNDDDMASAINWCKANDDSHTLLSTAELATQFSHLKTLHEPALLRPNVATIKPHKLLAALTDYLTRKGVTFFNNHARLLVDNKNTVTAVQLNNRAVKAEQYIICGGAWSSQLIPSSVEQPDISPVKGQMICFPPTHIPSLCMVMDGNRYIIPRKDGRVVVGSTREHTGFDANTTQQAFNELRDFAQQLYPALTDVEPDTHWAGLRPATPNSIPYICRVEPYKNLSLNAGHYRNGIVTAPASAQLMADILLNKKSHLDPNPYKITRQTS
ncbi:MAG: glycine oxidase [Cycloclasticus sp. symbiont of Bathymodiolus heckerae]|nr:MAG: glycine oxidase [Cycloclasticus sp. symbiont of Bathymodiolus heckerae]